MVGAAALGLAAVAPLATWAERRVKAWVQLRRGPPPLQVYRDLRRWWRKRPLVPSGASPLYPHAAALSVAVLGVALFTLPLSETRAALGGGLALLVLGLLLTLHRFVMTFQAYDSGTAFGGLGASRELFLGGLGEPVFLLVAAAVFLKTGHAEVPPMPLDLAVPSTWLVGSALVLLWVAESARVPFDNPATHLELTMVHEALVLEASGWILAAHEAAAMLKQSILASVLVLLFVPLPGEGGLRVVLLLASVVALSGLLALFESSVAKVRLFRASHLLVAASLLAFFGGAVTYLEGGLG